MPGGGYKSTKRERRSIKEEVQFEEIGEKINKLKIELDELKAPIGKKDNPARYCKDMMKCKKDSKDG